MDLFLILNKTLIYEEKREFGDLEKREFGDSEKREITKFNIKGENVMTFVANTTYSTWIC